MCEVHAFRVSDSRRRAEANLSGGSGQVIIFPGVRVERREFTPEEESRLTHLPRKARVRARRHPLRHSETN